MVVLISIVLNSVQRNCQMHTNFRVFNQKFWKTEFCCSHIIGRRQLKRTGNCSNTEILSLPFLTTNFWSFHVQQSGSWPLVRLRRRVHLVLQLALTKREMYFWSTVIIRSKYYPNITFQLEFFEECVHICKHINFALKTVLFENINQLVFYKTSMFYQYKSDLFLNFA